MKEYAYDEDSVRALTEWAAKASFPKEMRLNDAEYIFTPLCRCQFERHSGTLSRPVLPSGHREVVPSEGGIGEIDFSNRKKTKREEKQNKLYQKW